MIASLALLVLQERASHGPEPGPRSALAGLGGFQSISRIDYGTVQNRLTATFVFPDRARWHFEDCVTTESSQHLFLYRHGETVHQLASGSPSQTLEGAERDTVLLQMELRRAAMLWPDGFDWQAGDGRRTARIDADSCCHERAVGTLVAVPAHGRPRRIEVRNADDQPVEALEIREWQKLHGRSWPREMVLEAEGGGFVETVESIEPRVHYLELSFLPADQRTLPGTAASPTNILAQDLVAMTYRVRDLPDGSTWEQAIAKAREWIAEAGETLRAAGLTVDPVPTFEVSGTGNPQRCLVRLTTAVQPAPKGFQTMGDRLGLLVPLERLPEVDSATLTRLRTAIPKDAAAGAPYVRVHTRPTFPIELVLPLVPSDLVSSR